MSLLRRLQAKRIRRQVRRGGGRPVPGQVEYDGITEELDASGLSVEPYEVSVQALDEYVSRARYTERPYYEGGHGGGAREKYLEHFVSLELMRPKAGEVLIDIACMLSPFSEIVEELYGLETYRQDLMYPVGIEGRRIGGDAAEMPIPDAFADHLTLHCSFEHFEGDSDSRFIREAARVLKPGGKLCILPLYTAREYAIQTFARGWRRFGAPFDAGDLVYVGERWGPPHSRFYDAEAFRRRVVDHLGQLRLSIFEVTNVDACGGDCYLRYVAMIEKPA